MVLPISRMSVQLVLLLLLLGLPLSELHVTCHPHWREVNSEQQPGDGAQALGIHVAIPHKRS